MSVLRGQSRLLWCLFFFLLFFFHCFFLAVKYQWKIWKVLSISTSLRISRCMSDPIVRPREIEYPKQLWGVEMAGGVWRIIFLSIFNGKSFRLISAGDSLRLGRLNAGGGNGVGRFFLWGGGSVWKGLRSLWSPCCALCTFGWQTNVLRMSPLRCGPVMVSKQTSDFVCVRVRASGTSPAWHMALRQTGTRGSKLRSVLPDGLFPKV